MTNLLDFMCQLILSMAVGFTFGAAFACLNMKKLAKILVRRSKKYADFLSVFFLFKTKFEYLTQSKRKVP